MPNLLIEESPQVYKPTLAAWIGLNEAIFLQQLHYIITNNESVGKFVDGRKWYRDKPRDFMVKYFPFWDEGTVKRTITNLKTDALILARSDLNEDPQNRSLWYTVHYEAIERLTGPVERILDKSEKRKEARKARKQKPIENDSYTKVQNVLLNDDPTNCTFDPGTICTDAQVQIVPTPKESLSKNPLPKEQLAANAAPPLAKSKKPKEGARASPEQQQLFLVLAGLCHISLRVATDKQIGQLDQATKALLKMPIDTPQFKVKFTEYWEGIDWRGKQGQPPTPAQIREVYGDYCHWLENGCQKVSRNGQHKPTKDHRTDIEKRDGRTYSPEEWNDLLEGRDPMVRPGSLPP